MNIVISIIIILSCCLNCCSNYIRNSPEFINNNNYNDAMQQPLLLGNNDFMRDKTIVSDRYKIPVVSTKGLVDHFSDQELLPPDYEARLPKDNKKSK